MARMLTMFPLEISLWKKSARPFTHRSPRPGNAPRELLPVNPPLRGRPRLGSNGHEKWIDELSYLVLPLCTYRLSIVALSNAVTINFERENKKGLRGARPNRANRRHVLVS